MNDYAALHNQAMTALDKRRLADAYALELCAISRCQDAALCLLMSAFAAQMALDLLRYEDARCLCAMVAALTQPPPKPKRGQKGVMVKPVLTEWQAQTGYARKEAERISKAASEKCNGG